MSLRASTTTSKKKKQVELNISQKKKKKKKKKTEVMMLNVAKPSPVKVNGGDLPTTEEFTYLDNPVRHDGGAGSDIGRSTRPGTPSEC